MNLMCAEFPMFVCVEGEAKYRERNTLTDGWGGGIPMWACGGDKATI
jgi:hypothetical protein